MPACAPIGGGAAMTRRAAAPTAGIPLRLVSRRPAGRALERPASRKGVAMERDILYLLGREKARTPVDRRREKRSEIVQTCLSMPRSRKVIMAGDGSASLGRASGLAWGDAGRPLGSAEQYGGRGAGRPGDRGRLARAQHQGGDDG